GRGPAGRRGAGGGGAVRERHRGRAARPPGPGAPLGPPSQLSEFDARSRPRATIPGRGRRSARRLRFERRLAVADPIEIGGIHHPRLTVTDVQRSRDFYTGVLGFDVAVESPPADDPSAAAVYPVLWGGVVMVRGGLLLGLRPVAPGGDRFDEDRVGLDHLS